MRDGLHRRGPRADDADAQAAESCEVRPRELVIPARNPATMITAIIMIIMTLVVLVIIAIEVMVIVMAMAADGGASEKKEL
jgi:hypothetical protein